LTTAFAIALSCASLASAQTTADEHAAHHSAVATAPNASAPASAHASSTDSTSAVQDNMKGMQDLMAQIRRSKDPRERRQLMQEHMKAMSKQMDMMHGMDMEAGQIGMMGRNHSPGGADSIPKEPEGGSKGGDTMKHEMMTCSQPMQKRMDMMQMMMEQMVQHQEMQEESKARK